ncbi:MAG TPA: cytochrome C peroxidase [Saprospirales bacterium]|nr:cytochrome C peroxidase [Saprospirales bacterium]
MKHFLQKNAIILVSGLLIAFMAMEACRPQDPDPVTGDLEQIPYNPQSYTIPKPSFFPEIPIPADNPNTVDGVQLGRRLFYDPILSADSTMSCSSCHLPEGSFTDNKKVSTGIDGIAGKRNSMSLLNIAYVTDGFFWDGRAPTLEAQALAPVEDPIELHNDWGTVVAKLKAHPTYPSLFRKAFGIKDRSEITKELAAKAIAQFERILISSGTSKFDRFVEGDVDAFDDEEIDGKLMFFDEGAQYNLPDAQCFHCHGGVTLTGGKFFNNGLDSVGNLNEFKDLGRFLVTGLEFDKGKFRATTVRNIALTAPYMHDGRFETLEEVIEQYHDNGFGVANEGAFLNQIGFPVGNGTYTGLTEYQKKALVKFLHTLTDTTFIKNPDIQNPF